MIHGYLLGIIYGLVTSSAIVFISYVDNKIPIEVSLFYMALSGSIVFNLIEYKNFVFVHKKLVSNKLDWSLFSLAFLANCFFSYYSAVHTSPEIYVAIFFLTAAFCSCFFEKKYVRALASCLAVTIIYLLTKPNILAFMSSLSAGFSVFIYYVTSYKFEKKTKMNSSAIVAIRCYALLFFSICYLIIQKEYSKIFLDLHQIKTMLFLVLINIIIPSFLSQKCLSILGVGIFTRMNSLIPVLVFIINAVCFQQWIGSLFIICIMTTVILNYKFIENIIKRIRMFLLRK